MKKKLFSVILAVLLIVGLMPAIPASAETIRIYHTKGSEEANYGGHSTYLHMARFADNEVNRLAFCLNPRANAPGNGYFNDARILERENPYDSLLIKCMYYLYRGPGYEGIKGYLSTNYGNMFGDPGSNRSYGYSHAIASYAYNPSTAVYRLSGTEIEQIVEILEYIDEDERGVVPNDFCVFIYNEGVNNSQPMMGWDDAPVGTLQIEKITEHNNGLVAGFNFEVRNSSGALVGTYITSSTGIIDIPDLLPGDYSITEVGLSSDFVAPTNNPKYVTIHSGETTKVTFHNVKKRGYIQLSKTNANPSLGDYSLAGAVFEVRNEGDVVVGTITTFSGGFGYTYNPLPLGKYTIKEIQAPYGFVLNENTFTVELSGELEAVPIVVAPEIQIPNTPQSGRINIEKRNGDPGKGDYPLEGAVFDIIDDSSGLVVDTVTTDVYGNAQSKELKLGDYTVVEKTAPYGYILNTNTFDAKLIYGGQTVPVVYATIRVDEPVQVGRINIEKRSSPLNQTDYPLNGAVFEIKDSNGILVDTVTTDVNGNAQSKELKLGNYTVTEKTAPYGYVRNKNTLNAKLEYGGQNVPVVYVTVRFDEIEQIGRVTITKKDKETGTQAQGDATLSGAVFDLLDSKGNLVERLRCGNNTSVTSKEIPLGKYIVKEVTPPRGYTLSRTEYPVEIEYAGQEKEVVLLSVDVQNKVIEGYIQILKRRVDPINPVAPENRLPLKDVVFEVYLKSAGSYANAKPTERDRITTVENGIATTKDLPYGIYTIREVVNAQGHTISAPVEVNINEDGQIYIIAVDNTLATGKVTIEKRGELLVGASKTEDGEYTRHTPRYENRPLPGAVFEIRARSDIVTPDGKVQVEAGTLVDTVTTDADGKAESKLLYLGDYYAVEIKAPFGMVLDETERDFSLVYKDQNTPIVFSNVGVADERQKAEVSLTKYCELPENAHPDFNPYANIVFGLFAREDIKSADGDVVIPKDGLLEYITPDKDGNATIQSDLPFGSYYIVELKTGIMYLLNDTEYDFTFEYAGDKIDTVEIAVNDGNAIQNILRDEIHDGTDTLVSWRDNKTVPGGTFGNGMTYLEIDVEKAREERYTFGIADSSPHNRFIGYYYHVKVEGDELVVYFDNLLISTRISAKVYADPPDKHDPSHHTTLINNFVDRPEIRFPLPAASGNGGSNDDVTAVIEGNGNKRTLTITVDGVKYPNQPWSNNSSSEYEIDGYKINVAVKGNKVSSVTVLERPNPDPGDTDPPAKQIVYLFVHMENGISYYDTLGVFPGDEIDEIIEDDVEELRDDEFTVTSGQPVSIDVLTNDDIPADTVITEFTQPNSGSVVFEDGTFLFTPEIMDTRDTSFAYSYGGNTAVVKLVYADSIRYEDTLKAVQDGLGGDGQYEWGTFLLARYSGGSALRSGRKNDTITVKFYGTGIEIIGYKSWSRGIVDITVDGVKTMVDTFDMTYDQTYDGSIYTVSGLTQGTEHTLTIRVTGDRFFLASGTAIDIDAFVVSK